MKKKHPKGCECGCCLKIIPITPPPLWIQQLPNLMAKLVDSADCSVSFFAYGKFYSWQIGHTYVLVSSGVALAFRPYFYHLHGGLSFKCRRAMAGEESVPFTANEKQMVQIIERMFSASEA